MQSQMLRARKLELTTSHGFPSPKCQVRDVDAYMTTPFGGEAWDLY